MGYNIHIGNAVIRYDAAELSVEACVEYVDSPGAPVFNDTVGTGNMRSPGHTQWSEFCENAGITSLFYGSGWNGSTGSYSRCPDGFHREYPLFNQHPGIQAIGVADLEYVKAARIRREALKIGPPGFWGDDNVDNGNDPVLARLMWLEFWFDWALKNCQYPSVYNS